MFLICLFLWLQCCLLHVVSSQFWFFIDIFGINCFYSFSSALNSPGTYFPQIQRLERARKEDFLNHAIQERPERDMLVQKHILEGNFLSKVNLLFILFRVGLLFLDVFVNFFLFVCLIFVSWQNFVIL